MDKYLQPNSAYERLWAEYQKHGSLIVAVDFDDTLYDFHGTGGSYEQVKQLVRDLKAIGCYIIINTGNEDTNLITTYCNSENIPYDSINEHAPFVRDTARKIYANVYVDDRAGLEHVYNDLRWLVHNAKKKTFYRVCHEASERGLWYFYNGKFSGAIHNEFNFCKNNELKMDFDPELVGWLSATDNLEDLYNWFTKEDILALQKEGWYIHSYESSDYKFYDRFQHYIINQDSSVIVDQIVLEDEGI